MDETPNNINIEYLSEYEERLVRLVHLLASGTPQEYGLTFYETKQFLTTPLKGGKNAIQELKQSDKLIKAIERKLYKK